MFLAQTSPWSSAFRVVNPSGCLKQLKKVCREAPPRRLCLPKSWSWRASTASTPGSPGSSGGRRSPTWSNAASAVSPARRGTRPPSETPGFHDNVRSVRSTAPGAEGGSAPLHHGWTQLRSVLLHHRGEATERRAVPPRQPVLPLPGNPAGEAAEKQKLWFKTMFLGQNVFLLAVGLH